jgi:hypothetical protein
MVRMKQRGQTACAHQDPTNVLSSIPALIVLAFVDIASALADLQALGEPRM